MIINWLWYPFFFLDFQNMKKMKFFMKICLEKFLVFDRMYENSTFVFCFFKGKINLKVFKFFLFLKKNLLNFFWNILEKTGYFNTGFVFYSINIQPDIMQNW